MSDVLIKNMKMPESCDKCSMQFGACIISCNPYLNSRPSDCPLIELPPHGDLIDREKTVNRITELSGKITNQLDYYASAAYTLIALFLQNKHEFPTVIEAEDGE